MSLNGIKSQVIDLIPVTVPIYDPQKYTTRLDPNNTNAFQVGTDYFSDRQYISNGDFSSATDWIVGADWTISGGQATKADTGNSELQQYINLVNKGLYAVEVKISDLEGGDAVITTGGRAGSISRNGTHRWFVESFKTDFTTTNITFKGNISTVTYAIDSVSVRKLCTAGYRIKNDSGSILASSYDGTNTIVAGEEGTQMFNSNIFITPDISGLASDMCYTFTVLDRTLQSNILSDNNFVQTTGRNWNAEGAWIIGGGSAAWASTPGDQNLTQNLHIPAGYEYTLGISFSIYGSGDLQVYVDAGLQGTLTPGGTGTESLTIDLTGVADDQTFLQLTGDGVGGSFTIDDAFLTIKNVSDLPDLLHSQKIALGDDHTGGKNTKVVTVTFTNTKNYRASKGYIDYTNFDYTQYLTIQAWLKEYELPTRRKSVSIASGGKGILNSSAFAESWMLTTENLPAYHLLALRAALEHNTVTITGIDDERDGAWVFLDDDVEIDYNDTHEYGVLRARINPKTSVFENLNC